MSLVRPSRPLGLGMLPGVSERSMWMSGLTRFMQAANAIFVLGNECGAGATK
jgi:hypothetical protein